MSLKKQSGFFADDTIPADTYKGVGAVKTLAVGAQWVTSDKADANMVYEIVKALYSDAGLPGVFFTYSVWDSPAHLDAYRNSELFRTTWAKTKAWFADRAQAGQWRRWRRSSAPEPL